MAVNIAPAVRQQFLDVNGNPLSGAKLFVYIAGTTTKTNTYTTSAGVTPNSNPIVLDSAGRSPYGIWLDASVIYKFVFAPSTDTDPPVSAYYTEDNITNDYSTAIAGAILSNGSSTITANIPFSGFKITGLANPTVSGDAISWGCNFTAGMINCAGLRSTVSIGYHTGSGGTVTQITSKSTAVTLNALSGTITTHAASLAADTAVSFTFHNSNITGAGNFLLLNTSLSAYKLNFSAMAAGSCVIGLRNISAGALAEAVPINFLLLYGTNS